MKVVKPETVGLDATVLKNIREYLDETYVKEGKYVGTMTLVSRKGEVAYLDSLGMMDRENKIVLKNIWKKKSNVNGLKKK